MNAEKEKSAVGVGAPATEKEINSENIITQAVEKINSCNPKISGRNSRYASAIAEPVKKALAQFCTQQEEFSRAVLDGGTTEDCINAVVKRITGKTSVSDLDVYQAAAEFFFPGAKIEFRMLLHMSEYELLEDKTPEPEQPKRSIDLSLDSLLDW